MGMCSSTAACMSVYQVSTSVSIVDVGVLGANGGGSGVLCSVVLNPSQFALL